MRVVVCGAGIAGLTLANRLVAGGHEVVLLERTPEPRPQGYMIDFFGPGYDAAEAMGLMPALEDVAYHLDEATLVDARGRRRAGIDPLQFAGGPLLSLMRPDLEAVLRESLPSEVELRYGRSLVAVDRHDSGVGVTLDDGTAIACDLLVGADGIHSTVRRLVFGAEAGFLRYLGFHTSAFVFESARIHAEVKGRFCLTDTVGRQMGFYGLRDGRVATFAVHRTPGPAVPTDLRRAVREAYGNLGWIVPEALAACPPAEEIYYDQVAQVELPTWSRGRVVLVGDAAYAVSLLAGQGASLGMAGAWVLADQLERSDRIERALGAYERLWRPVAEGKQQVARSAARWFLPRSRSQLWVRRAMLKLIRLPLVNRTAAATVAGKSTAVIHNLRNDAEPVSAVSSDTRAERR